jgi:hypothetical protein
VPGLPHLCNRCVKIISDELVKCLIFEAVREEDKGEPCSFLGMSTPSLNCISVSLVPGETQAVL